MGRGMGVIDQATLDELWDFADPATSEPRFRASDDAELRAELARALHMLAIGECRERAEVDASRAGTRGPHHRHPLEALGDVAA